MKLLHVTPFYEPYWAYGGMVRASAALCRALVRRGHDVTVATAVLEPGPPRDETRDGVRIRRFPGPRGLARRLVPWPQGLGDFLAAELPGSDIAHLHGFRHGLAVETARACRRAGRAYLLSTHGCLPHHGQRRLAKALFDRAFGARIVDGAAVLVALSASEARDLPRPSRIVPNGIDACGSAGRTPAREPRTSRRGRLLFVGNDRPQKRGLLLPALLAALPEAELQLVGPMGPRFLHAFAPLGDRVSARGVLHGQDLADAYADADLLVHPAVGEAFGLVPFEAALAGLAGVVASGHGCGEWYRTAGGSAVPADDQAALVGAVRTRLASPALRAEEACRVAAFAREHLTWDEAAAAIEGLYREIREGRP